MGWCFSARAAGAAARGAAGCVLVSATRSSCAQRAGADTAQADRLSVTVHPRIRQNARYAAVYPLPRAVQSYYPLRGKRWRYDAVDLTGININISGVDSVQAPTRGRMLDHTGFEVENLRRSAKSSRRRASSSIGCMAPLASGFGLAFLTDPWDTYIELTQGLRGL